MPLTFSDACWQTLLLWTPRLLCFPPLPSPASREQCACPLLALESMHRSQRCRTRWKGGLGRRKERAIFRGAAHGWRVAVSEPWTVVPHWERGGNGSFWHPTYTTLLSSGFLCRRDRPAAPPSTCGLIKHRSLVCGTQDALLPNLTEAGSQKRRFRVSQGLASCLCQGPEQACQGLWAVPSLLPQLNFALSRGRRHSVPNKTLFIDSETSFLCNFHMSKIFFIFSQH